ncbi:MAG: hypothetical protein AMJ53_16965 [Gammaproteobacteria bacterium SG8_11]|nr:MAG: hypothetical protein AMJ53_16965 [Gammaproteobacteria bacterium SG8_11]
MYLSPLYGEEIKDENLINWYYAHEFGTGAYKVGDTTVQIFHIPISYTLRPISEKKFGVKFVMPLTFGYHNFKYEIKDIIDKIFEEDFATATITPGMELEIPLYYDITLFPYLYAGYGAESSSGTNAFIYGSGVRLLSGDNWHWRSSKVVFGSAFTFAGYNSSDSQKRATTSLRLGVNLITPLKMKLLAKTPAVGVHFIMFFYFDELDFESEERQSLQLTNEYEVALTLGTKNPMSFLGMEFDRFGLAYRWSEELRAIKLIASFPF